MSLIFIPEVRLWANFYFFVQNLSGWHQPSVKSRYNNDWREETAFSQEAEVAINAFKLIHDRYPHDTEKYLGRPFFLQDDPWEAVKNIVTKNELVELKNIFNVLEPFFNIIYKKDEPLLHEWAELISKPEFAESAAHLNDVLAKFYGCEPYSAQCTVYLLLSAIKGNGGSVDNTKTNSIKLEVSRMPIALEWRVRGVLWHELIHLHFSERILRRLLRQYTQDNVGVVDNLEELLTSALLPNGLLAKEIGINEMGNRGFNPSIQSEEILQIQRLIRPYLDEEKQMDESLVRNMLALTVRTK